MVDRRFRDRRQAGRALVALLGAYEGRDDVVVLALPRGGVPVGFEVAMALRAPLDVFVVRKMGVPGHEELAMGAMASGGVVMVNDATVARLGISEEAVLAVIERETRELARRERQYRGARPTTELLGKVAIVVDDGLATGSSMRAAVAAVRTRDPCRIVVAIPTAPRAECDALDREVDDVVCVTTPPSFLAVGESYVNFQQTTDEEVSDLLARSVR